MPNPTPDLSELERRIDLALDACGDQRKLGDAVSALQILLSRARRAEELEAEVAKLRDEISGLHTLID